MKLSKVKLTHKVRELGVVGTVLSPRTKMDLLKTFMF